MAYTSVSKTDAHRACRFKSCHGHVLIDYPSWKEAKEGDTPGQLEPQLSDLLEPRIHVLTDDHMNSVCGTAVMGDRAITLEQARDMENDLFFDCEDCYKILSNED